MYVIKERTASYLAKEIGSCNTLQEAEMMAACASCNPRILSVVIFRVWADSIMSHYAYVETYKSGYKV